MPSYPVPLHEIRRELVIANSRFIACLAPVFSVDEAKGFIQRIKAEFPDATHHVPVYLVGHAASEIAHCSDAGEPSGTAGRPALAVLRGSGLGDVAVVVTRYFGGTKLGTGGLVRAYSEAVRMVVEAVPRAAKVLTHTVMLVFPYTYLERIRLLVSAHLGEVLDEDFTAEVTLTARLRVEELPAFQSALSDLTKGKVTAEIIETTEILMPLTFKP
ncbi:MAG: YigZ family protein [Anaerolineales bacterium]|nr:YigZ family protein [Anaerolineae bacterium]PWB49503.1 MAG: YigZ family protein [Anaerolineales bacterium]